MNTLAGTALVVGYLFFFAITKATIIQAIHHINPGIYPLIIIPTTEQPESTA